MITSDTDLWPIDGTYYLMPHNVMIHSRKPSGHRNITSHNMSYFHMKMSFVGMRVYTWNQLLTPNKWNMLPTNVSGVIKLLRQELERVVLTNDRRSGPGWFTDQKILSYLLHKWINTYGEANVYFNYLGGRTIDRAGWHPTSLKGVTEAHLVVNPSSSTTWNLQLLPLLGLMYEHSVKDMFFCLNYYHKFKELQLGT